MKKQKVVLETTLAQLRKAGACVSGYNKVVRAVQGKPFTDEDAERDTYLRFAHKAPINLLSILDSNGVDDCLWALRAVTSPDVDRIARYIACDCADAVLHIFEREYPNDNLPRNAIVVARRFADGNATEEEMDAARAAAWAAARAAARAAAWAAAWAAARAAARAAAWDAAWDAAGDAAWDAAWDAQAKIIRSYLAEAAEKEGR